MWRSEHLFAYETVASCSMARIRNPQNISSNLLCIYCVIGTASQRMCAYLCPNTTLTSVKLESTYIFGGRGEMDLQSLNTAANMNRCITQHSDHCLREEKGFCSYLTAHQTSQHEDCSQQWYIQMWVRNPKCNSVYKQILKTAFLQFLQHMWQHQNSFGSKILRIYWNAKCFWIFHLGTLKIVCHQSFPRFCD